MKKLLLILSILAFACTGMAQDKSQAVAFQKDATYHYQTVDYELDGTADSLYINIYPNKEERMWYDMDVIVDTVAGADTTVTYQLYGRILESDSWSQISTTTSSAIGSETTFSFTDTDSPTWKMAADSTYTLTSFAGTAYRELQVRIIRTGDDATGGGIDVNSLAIKLWKPQF